MTDYEHYSHLFSYNPETGDVCWRAPRKGTTVGKPAGSPFNVNGRPLYLRISLDGKGLRAHRIAWLLHTGEWPKHEIDHIDGNPLNNRIQNLRDVSHDINKQNVRLYSTNSSGIHGVWWSNRDHSWRCYIDLKGVRMPLGRFADFFEACCSRKSAESNLGFHANHGRVAA